MAQLYSIHFIKEMVDVDGNPLYRQAIRNVDIPFTPFIGLEINVLNTILSVTNLRWNDMTLPYTREESWSFANNGNVTTLGQFICTLDHIRPELIDNKARFKYKNKYYAQVTYEKHMKEDGWFFIKS